MDPQRRGLIDLNYYLLIRTIEQSKSACIRGERPTAALRRINVMRVSAGSNAAADRAGIRPRGPVRRGVLDTLKVSPVPRACTNFKDLAQSLSLDVEYAPAKKSRACRTTKRYTALLRRIPYDDRRLFADYANSRRLSIPRKGTLRHPETTRFGGCSLAKIVKVTRRVHVAQSRNVNTTRRIYRIYPNMYA